MFLFFKQPVEFNIYENEAISASWVSNHNNEPLTRIFCVHTFLNISSKSSPHNLLSLIARNSEKCQVSHCTLPRTHTLSRMSTNLGEKRSWKTNRARRQHFTFSSTMTSTRHPRMTRSLRRTSQKSQKPLPPNIGWREREILYKRETIFTLMFRWIVWILQNKFFHNLKNNLRVRW